MKSTTLWQISVTTAREAEEATAALLERLFGQPASIYSPDGQATSVATVYASQKPDQVQSKREALAAGLTFLADCGLNLGPTKSVIRKVPREDWASSWKKYFKTIEIGSALLIKPSWSKRRARPGQSVVTLDPGLSFGTGQHPTTHFCLRQLVQTRKPGRAQSFLDIGSGSGILAIAAAKLGYRPVHGFDNDAVAVRVAKANARKNRILDKVQFTRRDLTQTGPTSRIAYDLICANLVHDVLISEAERIASRLARSGKLVLAGLLTSQFADAAEAYARLGFELETARTEGEWRSGAFARKAEAPGG
jgi:ribosomal protein L11 methyltransferase